MSIDNSTSTGCVTSYEDGNYNLPLRIASIFILLAFSFLGVATPSLVKGRDWKIIDQILYLGKFFGGGVITATGFIHIFPDAMVDLTDPCLTGFFSSYTASAGLFAMIGALFTHLMQFLFNSIFVKREKENPDEKGDVESPVGHSHLSLESTEKANAITVYILEAGIAVHSIIIGVDLGLTVAEFQTLLIALVFHQFFEGIGLGYRLAELKSKNRIRPILNSLVYAFTTPIGVVIGILSQKYASPTDYVGAVESKGVVNGLAAGILIYVALVDMIFVEYNSESFRKLSVMKKVLNFAIFYLGAGIMAMIGVWA